MTFIMPTVASTMDEDRVFEPYAYRIHLKPMMIGYHLHELVSAHYAKNFAVFLLPNHDLFISSHTLASLQTTEKPPCGGPACKP